MNKTFWQVWVLVAVWVLLPVGAGAQSPGTSNQDDDILIIEEEGEGGGLIIEEEQGADLELLEKQLELLSDEIDDLRDDLGPLRKNVNVTGYGETHLRFPGDERRNQFDAHRFVIGINARFNDWIFLNAEIDYEHAAQQLEFEMAYLDFLFDPKINMRAGTVLIPVGFLNEFHEPVFFWTVERPVVQNRVIPTSWQGTGGGFFGTFGNFLGGMNWRIYAVNSVQSIRINPGDAGSGTGFGGASGRFRSSSGIRSGRLQPNSAIASDIAITGRVELPNLYPGFQLGASFYTGDTTHQFIPQGGRTTVLEADIKFRKKWFDMNATIAHINVNNAAEMNAFNVANGFFAANGVIPSGILGWNAQVGIHLPQLLGISTTHDVVVHSMYEFVDTQNEVPSGFVAEANRESDVFTSGIVWFPTPNVSMKMDYTHEIFGNGVSQDTFNLGMAYMFF